MMRKDKSQLEEIEKFKMSNKKLLLPNIKESETKEDKFLNTINASPRRVGKDVMKRQYLNSVLKMGTKRNSSYATTDIKANT